VEVVDLNQLEQLIEKLKASDKVISVTRYFRQVRMGAGEKSGGAGSNETGAGKSSSVRTV
jgi:hypothetical protein